MSSILERERTSHLQVNRNRARDKRSPPNRMTVRKCDMIKKVNLALAINIASRIWRP